MAPPIFSDPRIPDDLDRRSLVAAMETCMQHAGQSTLAHGMAVADVYARILRHVTLGGPAEPWWRLPSWLLDRRGFDDLPPRRIMAEYQIFHDCGKPFTRTVDVDGRVHFPGHATVSEAVWLKVGGDPTAARLMGMDMDAHLLRPDGVAEFASRPEAPALLVTAVAEVHANAAMFGGQDSDSFKMKAKHLEKRGRQVFALVDAALSASGGAIVPPTGR